VARTAHAEGQHKTTGESGGRRSSHGHGAGNGHHSHKSASAGTTTDGQPTTVSSATTDTHSVRAAAPAVQPTPVDATATAEGAVLSPAASPSASGLSDAVQPTAGNTPQTSNFIPATLKPAPAPVAPATPDVNATAADQLSESGSQATAVPTDAGLQAGASVGAAAAPQTAQPTDPQTPQATGPQATGPQASATAIQTTTPTASTDPVAAGTAASATNESPAPAGEAATTVSGQAGEPTVKHGDKAASPGAAMHDGAQTDSPNTTSATAQPQGPSTGTQDPGQNGAGGQPQPQPNQAPPHASQAGSQSQPEQAAPTQAANATTPTPGLAAGPTPQAAATAPTAATAAATGPARYGVGLGEAVETVKTTIELGARQGFSEAKIQLAPANLGQITIHLQKTADGIVAKVVADHSAAAQTMQQGGDDLRRSLQNSGLHLLRLDIETRGDQRGSANGGTQTSQSDRTAGENDTAADDGASQPTTIVLPNGALVNVLA
jgi:flagellar hook-length control protein FliK